jgi:lipid-A-disaccharide synthase
MDRSADPVDFFIIAGEPSGDLHGARLIEQLLRARPDVRIAAVAGPRMRSLGIPCFAPMESLKVMGFTDVLVALPKIARFFFSLRKHILTLRPKAVITIDYPGFNLRLQRALSKRGYQGRRIHYVCPTVWAWGKGRIRQMAEDLDLLIPLLPFEAQCFRHTQLRVEYHGHPLAAEIKPAPLTDTPLLALFPGSRPQEITRNLPLQLQAARQLQADDPTVQIAISSAGEEQRRIIQSLAPEAALYPPSENRALMRACRLALATSGTVTLELALHGTPTIVTYAVKPWDQFLVTRILRIRLPYYSLPNLILGFEVFPELFGSNLTLSRLAHHAHTLWSDSNARSACRAACLTLREQLWTPSFENGTTALLLREAFGFIELES